MLFGINVIYGRQLKRAAIVEAEIDAMTLMTAGIPAVATLGAQFSKVKADMIRRSPIENLIIVRDNDAAGKRWQRQIIDELRQDLSLSIVTVNRAFKDVNEAGIDNMRTYFTRERRIRQIRKILL
jgi:DNA primase